MCVYVYAYIYIYIYNSKDRINGHDFVVLHTSGGLPSWHIIRGQLLQAFKCMGLQISDTEVEGKLSFQNICYNIENILECVLLIFFLIVTKKQHNSIQQIVVEYI